MDYNNQTYKVVTTSQGDCITREAPGNEGLVKGYYSNPGQPVFVKPRGDTADVYGSSRYVYPGEAIKPSTTRYNQQPVASFQKPAVSTYKTKPVSTQVQPVKTYEPPPVRQLYSTSKQQRPISEVMYHETRDKPQTATSWNQRKGPDLSGLPTANTVPIQNSRPARVNEGRHRPEGSATTQVPTHSRTEVRNSRPGRSETPAVRQQYARDIVSNPNTNREASQHVVNRSQESIRKPDIVQNHYTTINGYRKPAVESSSPQQTRPFQDHSVTEGNMEIEKHRNSGGVQLDVHPLMYFIPLTCLAILLLAQTVVICHSENNKVCSQVEYALPIVMSTITIVLCCIIPLFWVLVMDEEHSIESTAHILSPWLSVILVVCWVWVTPVITFNYPFQESGNGYFFAWGLFAISLIFARDVNEEFSNLIGKASHITMGKRFDRMLARALILASLFFTIAAIDSFEDNGRNANGNNWEGWLVVIMGPILFLVLLGYEIVLLYLGLHQELTREDDEDVYEPELGMKILSIPLAVLWFFIATVATFNDTSPFMKTGNGYYASWLCAMGSLGLAAVVHGFVEEFGV